MNAGYERTRLSRVPVMELERLQKLASESEVAARVLATGGLGSVTAICNVANVLHQEGRLVAAAAFYQQAYVSHSKSPHDHPSAHRMLQASMICTLKAGQDVSDEDITLLRQLSIPFADYISGMRAWLFQKSSMVRALAIYKNAFEEFHSGEEADTHYLSIASQYWQLPDPSEINPRSTVNLRKSERIPRNLFLYWDKAPPAEIAANLEYHKELREFSTTIYDKEKAEHFLYEYYGPETRQMFRQARHPAEAADILRVFVIKAFGGYWLDADLRLAAPRRLLELVPADCDGFFMLTHGSVVHNDMFGCIADSPILSECVNVLTHNFYLHRGLYIPYRTGPGIFARALNRFYYRAFISRSTRCGIHVRRDNVFREFVEEFPVTYKHGSGSWHTV